MKAWQIETPLGPMVAVADEEALHRLEFADCFKQTFPSGKTEPILSLERELSKYFAGKLKQFKTPLYLAGTDFQKQVWKELQKIPHGETRSYRDLARAIGRPTAFRAVAQANGANRLAIVIPCHRVIETGGGLGGYSAGIERKKRLLEYET